MWAYKLNATTAATHVQFSRVWLQDEERKDEEGGSEELTWYPER